MPTRRHAVLLVLLLSTGCSSVTTLDGERLALGSDALGDYVEDVFRRQNRVASDIAFALDDPEASPSRLEALDVADRGLLDACAPINEVAARRRDEVPVGWVKGSRAAHAAPDCERAVDRARAVLDAGLAAAP